MSHRDTMRGGLVAVAGVCALLGASVADARPLQERLKVGKVAELNRNQCRGWEPGNDVEKDIGRVEVLAKGISHHLHVYMPLPGVPLTDEDYPCVYSPDPSPDPVPGYNKQPWEQNWRDDKCYKSTCDGPVDFEKFILLAAAQGSERISAHKRGFIFDPLAVFGAAFHLNAHQPFLVQTHFNGPDRKPASVKIRLIPTPTPPSHYAAGLVGFYKNFEIPGVGPSSMGPIKYRVGGPPSDPQGSRTVMTLQGHYHTRGTRFEIRKLDAQGSANQLVYVHTGYSDLAKLSVYDGLGTWDDCNRTDISPTHCPRLPIAPGEGLEIMCFYNATAENNPSGQPIKMGPSTQANEHCNFFGSYFFDPIGDEKQEGILVRGNNDTGIYERCVTGVCTPNGY